MMRRTLPAVLAVAACLTVAGCSGHVSHLSQDDQSFCASLADDPVRTLRADVEDLLRDNHFATQGDAFAFATVDLQQTGNLLDNTNLQDSGLAHARSAVTAALLDLSIATSPSQPSADEQKLQQVHAKLDALQRYCDTH